MPNPPDHKREAILDAARLQFTRYGYRRTSMEDIARETGVSRASLYSYFDNKEEIFRCLAAKLHEQSLADAESQLKPGAAGASSLAASVEAALLARLRPFQEVVSESAHGAEIYDESSRLCGDLVVESAERFITMLSTALSAAARAGEIDLKAAGLTARSAAELVHLSSAGLKQGASDVSTIERRVKSFVRVFFAGLEA